MCVRAGGRAGKKPRVLLISAADDTFPNILNQAEDELASTGRFCRVDQWNTVTLGIPPLSKLSKYDSVVVYSYVPPIDDLDSLGNVLADYVDNGGGTRCVSSHILTQARAAGCSRLYSSDASDGGMGGIGW